MIIEFDIPHVFGRGSNRVENSRMVKLFLDMLIRVNMDYLDAMADRGRAVPPLYQSGVRYGRTETWDSIPALYSKKYGDCKSLTAAYVAQKRRAGIECRPVHRFVEMKSGATLYHILVQLPGGKFTDPSKVLGMGKDEMAHF